MPRLAVNFEDEHTVVLELGDLVPPRQIGIAWHAERTPSDSARALISIATELGDALVEPTCSAA
jgi:DNA-binding transcriptional LysR family regulator